MTAIQTLTTARLTLRPFRLGDAEDLFGIRGNREAMRHWDWPHDESLEQTVCFAETMLADMRV